MIRKCEWIFSILSQQTVSITSTSVLWSSGMTLPSHSSLCLRIRKRSWVRSPVGLHFFFFLFCSSRCNDPSSIHPSQVASKILCARRQLQTKSYF
ncbi:uncharacterized protein K452DRAFT_154078 [Aplosporella prunicola CBS 121167]|uniref:Uncharacterized protein n=1 Tax=Aplosporella prunicola CBS 121167 TaxID=1176127 RepID=A0A6A6BLK1_9PEZI|nr:uncharacterized protein K452DRAFT_154078 [Aplosporella prunicola CBS 121167]KAF2144154.1 hypothetical protein K452DRAFT_154078 [Aplosporella prunicola CBS 121167]